MGERLLELRLPARAGELKRMRHAVKKALVGSGLGDDGARDVVLALDEACQNIIRHAYGPERQGDLELAIERSGSELVFFVTDWAPRIDPSKVQPRALDDVRPGGLGTFLIRELMDEADFVEPPPGCGNLLRMVKRIG